MMREERHAPEPHRPPDAAGARLAELRASAAAAYASITAADAALRTLAGHRVAAERVLRSAAMLHGVASRAAAAHDRARPGPVVLVTSRFLAGREWRERRSILLTALAEAERLLADTERALAAVKEKFAAQVHARADAATALRRLTAECAAARDELAAAGDGLPARDDGLAAAGDGAAAGGLAEAG